jgi:hypothetical protein
MAFPMSETEIAKVTDEELAAATNEELAAALTKAERFETRNKIFREAERRRVTADLTKPFNPKADVSADARYLWIRIFVWFWVVPVVAGIIYLLVKS